MKKGFLCSWRRSGDIGLHHSVGAKSEKERWSSGSVVAGVAYMVQWHGDYAEGYRRNMETTMWYARYDKIQGISQINRELFLVLYFNFKTNNSDAFLNGLLQIQFISLFTLEFFAFHDRTRHFPVHWAYDAIHHLRRVDLILVRSLILISRFNSCPVYCYLKRFSVFEPAYLRNASRSWEISNLSYFSLRLFAEEGFLSPYDSDEYFFPCHWLLFFSYLYDFNNFVILHFFSGRVSRHKPPYI